MRQPITRKYGDNTLEALPSELVKLEWQRLAA